MERKKMYFITTLEVEDDQIVNRKCVGYFEEYERAAQVVLENRCDICETIYNYAVIEAIKSGLCQYDINPHWFQYTGANSYVEIEPPKFAKNMVGFWS